ncbi:MAG: tripartite tricarboxylate transporter substrate-binding protein [Pseudomonadota bacterium]
MGFGVGGGTDSFSRSAGRALAAILENPVQVQNYPAGGGVAAYRELLARPADGCTLLALTSDYVVYDNAFPELVDLSKLAYLVRSHREAGLLLARKLESDGTAAETDNEKRSGVSFSSLVTRARAEQRTLKVGGTGARSFDRAAIDYAFSGGEIAYRYIPYAGSKTMLMDLLGGRLDLIYDEFGSTKSLIESGSIVPVVAFAHRVEDLPTPAPLAAVAGLNTPPPIWRGFVVHGATKPSLVEQLLAALDGALNSEDYLRFEKERGLYAPDERLLGEQFQASIQGESAMFRASARSVE